jgi:hypothetical protein|tara:strand:- start:139 stop:465 length:327 start_codon:yes stop_codon:yes gene_type:complete
MKYMNRRDSNASDEPKRLRYGLNMLMNTLTGTPITIIENINGNWQEIIDKKFYPYCSPGKVKNGCLTISVSDPSLVQEIQWQSHTILVRLRDLLGDESITQIKVSVGR